MVTHISHADSNSIIYSRIVNGFFMALPVIVINSSAFYMFGVKRGLDEMVFVVWLCMLMVCLGNRYPRFTVVDDTFLLTHVVASLLVLTARWLVLRFIMYPVYCWTVIGFSDEILRFFRFPPSDQNKLMPLAIMIIVVVCSFAYSTRTNHKQSKQEYCKQKVSS